MTTGHADTNTPGGKRESLTQKVGRALRHRLSGEEYAVGDKLPNVQELVEAYGVSRTVVREVLAQLQADGLVEVRHGVGAFVTDGRRSADSLNFLITDTDRISAILDILELRRGVEIESAGLAAIRRSPAQDARIREAYHVPQHRHRRRRTRRRNLILNLHRMIAAATNNRFYLEFLDLIAERATAQAIAAAHGGEEARLLNQVQDLQAEHRKIVEAIGAQDAEAAREAMRAHMVNSEKRFRALSMTEL